MLFGNKLVLNKADFSTDYFTDGWDYNYRRIGEKEEDAIQYI